MRIWLLSLLFASSLLAHKINLFAYDEQGIVYLHAYFTQSSPCKNCPIKLVDMQERILQTLSSDEEGKASVKLPASSFSIVVEGGMGHQQRIDYTAQSHPQEAQKTPPSEMPFEKVALGLVIIALFFGALFWIKTRHTARQ